MKLKTIITGLLLVFVAGSVLYMFAKETRNRPVGHTEASALPKPGKALERVVVVYYFHGDVRCPTCHKLESYAKEVVETVFAKEAAAGYIQWAPVNTDTAENEHYVKDYALVTKSIVLSDVAQGKEVTWRNLDQIWDLVGDKQAYQAYIEENIRQFIEEDHS